MVRNALAAGVALAVFGHFGAAHAAPFFGGAFDPGPRFGGTDSGPHYAPSPDTYRVRPHYAPSRRVGTKSAKSRESEKKTPAAEVPKGTLQIVVSIGQQRVALYSNGTRVAQSVVSTGMPGHPTPMGVFSVIQKDRYHHSNLYSNAPMPYMERITWSGVALHEGPLPGHPASHGCIRLTHEFAARLWTTAKLGARVFVLRNDMAPEDFSHPKLFQPIEKRPEVATAKPNDDARPMPVTVAQSETRQAGSGADLPGQPSTASGPAPNAVEPPVADTGDSGTATSVSSPEASSAPPVPAAVIPVKTDDAPKPAPAVFEPLKPSLPASRTAEPAKHSGQVAVFVSRKEKKVFVRQGFEPLFDMPVEIANPDAPLGTHVFTALELIDGGSRMRWNVLSVPGAEPRTKAVREARKGSRRSVEGPVVDSRPASSAADALDRISLPQEAIDRIDELLVPGSSLVISDYGLGGETGRSTDFIVVTR
ncbi:MAG TPA: L,D-transpeptidase family protein [Xanthobacteraceae bacterium]